MDSIFPCSMQKLRRSDCGQKFFQKNWADLLLPSSKPRIEKNRLLTKILRQKWRAFSLVWCWKSRKNKLQTRIRWKKMDSIFPCSMQKLRRSDCGQKFFQKNWADLLLPSSKPRIEKNRLLTKILRQKWRAFSLVWCWKSRKSNCKPEFFEKNGQHFPLFDAEIEKIRLRTKILSKKLSWSSPS